MSTNNGGIHFFKTTILGGIVFLVPVVIIVLILVEAADLMMMVAEPMAGWFPVDSIKGMALANVIAVLALILVCFIAGLVARGAVVRKTVEGIEAKVLTKIPGYVLVKGLLSGLHDRDMGRLHPVLANFEGWSRIGLEIERSDDGRVVVLIPSSPNPWSGPVHIMDAGRVRRLNLPMTAYIENIESYGKGTNELLTSLDLDNE